jgi:hypothetical protein
MSKVKLLAKQGRTISFSQAIKVRVSFIKSVRSPDFFDEKHFDHRKNKMNFFVMEIMNSYCFFICRTE